MKISPLFILQLLWGFLLFSCNANTNTTVQSKDTVAADSIKPLKASAKYFSNHSPFEIVSITNSINTNTTDTDTLKCSSWKLTKADVELIIKNAEPISGTVWDLSFLVLSCTKSIKVLQNGYAYDVEINAGAYFSVSTSDTTMLFGDYKTSDRKLFIEGPDKN